jgi:inner membrane protein
MRLFVKLAVVIFLALAILIPLAMVNGIIEERQQYRVEAVQSVARSHAGAQSLLGPVLVVPYVETVEIEEKTPQGTTQKVLTERNRTWTFFPATVALDATLKPDTRKLGLHEVRVYELTSRMVAAIRAEIPTDADALRPRRIGRPWLSFGVADVRGIVGSPRLAIDGRVVPLSAGFGNRSDMGGVHARLAAPRAGETLALSIAFDAVVDGTESLALVPIAKDNRMTLASPWPHPRFGGSFLPRTRTVDANGFRARWEVSSLATNAQAQFLGGAALPKVSGNDSTTDGIDAIGLSLVDPVNIYMQADRATKYGVLFVLLTFVGFFMFELIKALPIHPIQYVLVGLALAIFFLLLVSLSEHIAFGVAYLASAIACIGLLAVYLSAVLRSTARASGFAAMLGALYAALYGLLVSEDNALVLGACLLFAILAAIMVVTRKVDWYALQGSLRTA